MSEESKEVDPPKAVGTEDKPDKGKQPAVASDDEDDVEDVDEAEIEEAGAENTAEGTASASKKKKKKSKRKKIKAALGGKSDDPAEQFKGLLDKLPENELQELVRRNPELMKDYGFDPEKTADAFKTLTLNDVLTGLALTGKNAKDMGSYKFWKTQPVPKFDEISDKPVEEGPLEVKTVEDVPKEPQKLIDGFEWVTMDLTEDAQMKEVYQLLNGHYVEDDEAMFRFNYGTAILKWSLMAPGWRAEWHVGIRDCRVAERRPLVAFISAVPMTIRVRDKNFVASEVNFLCVHKKLRGKRLAPILIKEITRRSNLRSIWQGVYTGGIVLPKPVSTCRYYHRSLDWKKLYEIGFSPLPPGSKPEWQIRKFALPERTTTQGLREMQKKDVPAVHKLMTRYGKRYDMAPEWVEEETAHWLLQPRGEGEEQAVWTYVVEVSATSTVLDSSQRPRLMQNRTSTRTSPISSPSTTSNPPSSTTPATRSSRSPTCFTTPPSPASRRPSTSPRSRHASTSLSTTLSSSPRGPSLMSSTPSRWQTTPFSWSSRSLVQVTDRCTTTCSTIVPTRSLAASTRRTWRTRRI